MDSPEKLEHLEKKFHYNNEKLKGSGTLTTSLFVIFADTKPKVSMYKQGCLSKSCTADFL